MDDVWFYLPFPLKEERNSNLNIICFLFLSIGVNAKKVPLEGDRM